MARLDFALLALAATEEGDLFNFLRAGVEQLTVATLPVTTLLHLAARWDWDETDGVAAQTVGVECRDPQGRPLHEATYDVVRAPQPSDAPAARIIAPLPLTFQTQGLHTVELSVNRRVLKHFGLAVLAPDC